MSRSSSGAHVDPGALVGAPFESEERIEDVLLDERARPFARVGGVGGHGAGDAFVVEHFVDSPYERSRVLRVDTELPARINDAVQGEIGNVGFGGAFIALRERSLMEAARFGIGARVRVEFNLQDRQRLDVQGEVRWRRDTSRPAAEAGLGVQFVEMREDFFPRPFAKSVATVENRGATIHWEARDPFVEAGPEPAMFVEPERLHVIIGETSLSSSVRSFTGPIHAARTNS